MEYSKIQGTEISKQYNKIIIFISWLLLIQCILIIDEVVSALRMERNTYVVGKDVQRMQSRIMKEMSKDEDENEKESNDISEEDDS